MDRPELQRFYARRDSAAPLTRVGGPHDDLRDSRLAAFWRPLVDMGDSDLVPLRLRMVAPVADGPLACEPDTWPWCALLGVPGQRRQVLCHAGLDGYACREPAGLRAEHRTERWEALVAAVDRFPELDDAARARVVLQLLQLSWGQVALRVAGPVEPSGVPAHDRYVYEVARANARQPGRARRAIGIFARLTQAATPLLALASCYQGIGHQLRAGDLGGARAFEQRARQLPPVPDDWHAGLVRSRFHRALAMIRLAEGRVDRARQEIDTAFRLDEPLSRTAATPLDVLVSAESRRQLVQFRIESASRFGDVDLPGACAELAALDPFCVEARLTIGDAYAATADHAQAAAWYVAAGELGTGAGAVGWFRAGQCYEFAGDRSRALNAMARCLESDGGALDARQFLEAFRPWPLLAGCGDMEHACPDDRLTCRLPEETRP